MPNNFKRNPPSPGIIQGAQARRRAIAGYSSISAGDIMPRGFDEAAWGEQYRDTHPSRLFEAMAGRAAEWDAEMEVAKAHARHQAIAEDSIRAARREFEKKGISQLLRRSSWYSLALPNAYVNLYNRRDFLPVKQTTKRRPQELPSPPPRDLDAEMREARMRRFADPDRDMWRMQMARRP
jgi:hypothetical protein